MRGIAVALALGAGIQAFRQWPPSGPVSAWPAVVVMTVGIVLAYLAGKRGRQGAASATAVAMASAEASGNVLNVQVFSPNAAVAADPDPTRLRVPDVQTVEWLDHAQPAALEPLDVLDLEDVGLDLRDLQEGPP